MHPHAVHRQNLQNLIRSHHRRLIRSQVSLHQEQGNQIADMGYGKEWVSLGRAGDFQVYNEVIL